MENTEKAKLLHLLRTECCGDMQEEIMEWTESGEEDFEENLTEAQAHKAMEKIREYQAEKLPIQGGDIQHWDLGEEIMESPELKGNKDK